MAYRPTRLASGDLLAMTSTRLHRFTEKRMFPERLWEASVYRRGNLTLLEPPLDRRVGNAADALKVTAYGESHAALTRDIHDEALLHRTPERIDSRQQRRAVRAVQRWRANFA